jgi:hypothetical protein
MEHQWNDTDMVRPKYLEKNVSRCHSVHLKSHADWCETEPEALS